MTRVVQYEVYIRRITQGVFCDFWNVTDLNGWLMMYHESFTPKGFFRCVISLNAMLNNFCACNVDMIVFRQCVCRSSEVKCFSVLIQFLDLNNCWLIKGNTNNGRWILHRWLFLFSMHIVTIVTMQSKLLSCWWDIKLFA